VMFLPKKILNKKKESKKYPEYEHTR